MCQNLSFPWSTGVLELTNGLLTSSCALDHTFDIPTNSLDGERTILWNGGTLVPYMDHPLVVSNPLQSVDDLQC